MSSSSASNPADSNTPGDIKTTSTLTLPSATLAYTLHCTSPRNPLLLLISGANGDAGPWDKTASLLADKFIVISYSRRGFHPSPLKGEQPLSPLGRLYQDADDAAALITFLRLTPSTPVYVIGTSSGAIVALALLLRHADLLTSVIAHEPPLARAMSSPEATQALIDGNFALYEAYREVGWEKAVAGFLGGLSAEDEESRADAQAMGAAFGPAAEKNVCYWLQMEVRQYTGVWSDWLKVFGESEGVKRKKLRMAIGEGTARRDDGYFLKQIARNMGEKLGIETVMLPAQHVSYMTHPREFADRVVELFK